MVFELRQIRDQIVAHRRADALQGRQLAEQQSPAQRIGNAQVAEALLIHHHGHLIHRAAVAGLDGGGRFHEFTDALHQAGIVILVAADIKPPLGRTVDQRQGEFLVLLQNVAIHIGGPPPFADAPFGERGAYVVFVEPQFAVQLHTAEERHEMGRPLTAELAEGIAGGAGQKIDIGRIE